VYEMYSDGKSGVRNKSIKNGKILQISFKMKGVRKKNAVKQNC